MSEPRSASLAVQTLRQLCLGTDRLRRQRNEGREKGKKEEGFPFHTLKLDISIKTTIKITSPVVGRGEWGNVGEIKQQITHGLSHRV